LPTHFVADNLRAVEPVRRVHRKSRDVDWDVHNLTFSTFGRQGFFRGRLAPVWFLESLGRARAAAPFHLFAYVIMPEHIHIVLQPLPGVTMRRILWLLKRPVTARALAWVRENTPDFLRKMEDRQPGGEVTYRFWLRGGGYDRNLRSARDVHEKIAYNHDNPVRRGLVARPEDWPWSSAREWITREPGPVPIDWTAVPEPGL
jgi:putative transposase